MPTKTLSNVHRHSFHLPQCSQISVVGEHPPAVSAASEIWESTDHADSWDPAAQRSMGLQRDPPPGQEHLCVIYYRKGAVPQSQSIIYDLMIAH